MAIIRGSRDRHRSPSAKGRGKGKGKDRNINPAIVGTLDSSSDDDPTRDKTKGPAKGNAKGGNGGWRPAMVRNGRIDMSCWGCPLVYLPLALGPATTFAVAISRYATLIRYEIR